MTGQRPECGGLELEDTGSLRNVTTFVTHSYLTGTHGRYVRLETEDDATIASL